MACIRKILFALFCHWLGGSFFILSQSHTVFCMWSHWTFRDKGQLCCTGSHRARDTFSNISFQQLFSLVYCSGWAFYSKPKSRQEFQWGFQPCFFKYSENYICLYLNITRNSLITVRYSFLPTGHWDPHFLCCVLIYSWNSWANIKFPLLFFFSGGCGNFSPLFYLLKNSKVFIFSGCLLE